VITAVDAESRQPETASMTERRAAPGAPDPIPAPVATTPSAGSAGPAPPGPTAGPGVRGAITPGRLLKVLGVAFGLAVVIGNTIGMGILRTPGEVAARLPSVPLFLGIWVAGAAYALLGALSLAELGAAYPRSGGQYPYVRRALGPYPGFVVGWSDWLSTCGSMAAVAIVLGEYAGPLVPALAGREAATASAVVLGFALLQWRGIRIGDAAQQFTSLLKALALIGLAVIALVLGGAGAGEAAASAASASAGAGVSAPVVPAGLLLAAAVVVALQSAIFTYDGWTGPLYFGDEVKNPGHDIPRAMIGGVLLVMGIYLALNIAFLRVVPIGEMAGDPFVAATAAARIFGPNGDTVIRLLMILSLVAAVNALHLMASRIPYAMARDGLLPARMTAVNPGGTPVTSLATGTLIALGFIATNTFDTVLALLAFFFVANYALSFTSVFVLRRRDPDTPRPFRVPGYPWVPGIALAGSVAFLVAAVLGDRANSMRALGLLALSLPIYLVSRRAR
jgi:basic amino acid/polyamine antiporter, APA family